MSGIIKKQLGIDAVVVGSFAQKTYLPDSDIDLTVLVDKQKNPSWYNNVVDSLIRSTVVSPDAVQRAAPIAEVDKDFCISEVTFINADVKIVKCRANNLVIDISANKLNNTVAAAFVVRVDELIGKKHLFLRSLTLLKAWCRFESGRFVAEPILGADKSRMSSYCLCILLLSVFNTYAVKTPLHAFVYFFRMFCDVQSWAKGEAVTIFGRVPCDRVDSITDIENNLARKNSRAVSLDTVREYRSVTATAATGGPLTRRYLTVVDPLDPCNNLGRSINRKALTLLGNALQQGQRYITSCLSCFHYASHFAAAASADHDSKSAPAMGLQLLNHLFQVCIYKYMKEDGFRDDLLDHPFQVWVWRPPPPSADLGKGKGVRGKSKGGSRKRARGYELVYPCANYYRQLHASMSRSQAFCRELRKAAPRRNVPRSPSRTVEPRRQLRQRSPSPNPQLKEEDVPHLNLDDNSGQRTSRPRAPTEIASIMQEVDKQLTPQKAKPQRDDFPDKLVFSRKKFGSEKKRANILDPPTAMPSPVPVVPKDVSVTSGNKCDSKTHGGAGVGDEVAQETKNVSVKSHMCAIAQEGDSDRGGCAAQASSGTAARKDRSPSADARSADSHLAESAKPPLSKGGGAVIMKKRSGKKKSGAKDEGQNRRRKRSTSRGRNGIVPKRKGTKTKRGRIGSKPKAGAKIDKSIRGRSPSQAKLMARGRKSKKACFRGVGVTLPRCPSLFSNRAAVSTFIITLVAVFTIVGNWHIVRSFLPISYLKECSGNGYKISASKWTYEFAPLSGMRPCNCFRGWGGESCNVNITGSTGWSNVTDFWTASDWKKFVPRTATVADGAKGLHGSDGNSYVQSFGGGRYRDGRGRHGAMGVGGSFSRHDLASGSAGGFATGYVANGFGTYGHAKPRNLHGTQSQGVTE